MPTTEVQRANALAKANAVRMGRHTVKRRIRTGEMSVPEAIGLPCCASATVFDLLGAQFGWGSKRTTAFLTRLSNRTGVPIGVTRKCADLTERQISVLREALEER